jgi:hypothetical protein
MNPPGTSLEETDRMLVEVEKIIHTIPAAVADGYANGLLLRNPIEAII